MKQPTPQTSWWVGRNRKELNAEAERRAVAMSSSHMGRQKDSLQGLREHTGKPGQRSAMRLESN
jgi:hypothetical protein